MLLPTAHRALPLFLPALLLTSSATLAQAPPSTDVFLVSVVGSADERPVVGEPQNLTDRDGYDNQPAFLPDGSGLLYTSIRDGQADIYRYDFASKTTSPVTKTPESEYSPTPIPGEQAISVVRVELDGRQLLWRYPLDATSPPTQITTPVEPIGYHSWGPGGGLLVFVLGEPSTLQWLPSDQKTPHVVASDVGRSLHLIPGGNELSFITKSVPERTGEWWVQAFDPSSGVVRSVVATPKEREDLTWDAAGRIWMADGSGLYRHCPTCGGGWRKMADLGRSGIGTISRLTFSPDGATLAFVAERAATPLPPKE